MRNLPPIETAVGPSVLPMADASAAALLGAMLADDSSQAAASLVEVLSADPPLAVWSFCHAGKKRAGSLKGIAELAAWLAENVLELLCWPEGAEPAATTGGSWRSLLLESAAVRELARRRLETGDAAQRSKAALRALVHAAPRWLLLGAGRELTSQSPSALPWLESLSSQRGAAIQAVREAAAEWAKFAASGRGCDELCECLAVAETLADRWAAPQPPAAHCLPALAARLRRQRQLETEFHATVEAEKLEAMAEFAAGAGHEINNPLTVIAGRAQLLLREESSSARRKELALINAQAMRVFEMIADMRLFARPPKPEVAPCEVTTVMQQVIGELAEEATRREIDLVWASNQEPVSILADAVQISVAFRALCQNAMEAIGTRGRVEMTCGRGEAELEICVADNGPGIEPEQRRHIFDPYYSARQAGRGLGMGLCKAWVIAHAHGGRIEVESEPGQGAVFTLILPVGPLF